MAVESPTKGRSYMAFSLPSRQLYVIHGFRRRRYKVTWRYPMSKQWSCIDYVIIRESDRRMCSDVTVKRGAVCNTDHQFLRASMRMAWRGVKKRAGMNEGKRYDVSGLVSCKGSDDMSTGWPLQ